MHAKMERVDALERMRWSSRSPASKGPKRLCKFCLLAILLPVVCLCIPLYMRFQALKPHLLTLSPADMKLLNQARDIKSLKKGRANGPRRDGRKRVPKTAT